MAASYFAQAAFKETAEALFVLAFAIYLMRPGGAAARALAAGRLGASLARPRRRHLLLLLASPGSPGRSRSRRLGGASAGHLAGAAPGAGAADRAAALGRWLGDRRPGRRRDRADRRRPVRLRHGFNQVAGSNTYGPVSPVEALGIWPAANYRLTPPAARTLPGLMGAIARRWPLLVAVAWWVQRREAAVPARARRRRRPLPRLPALQRRLLARPRR